MKIHFIAIILLVLFTACKKKKADEESPVNTSTTTADINATIGFNVLHQLKGIWNGPVSSTTALGSYPEWIVDFRPIGPSQISAKNELDSLNDIHLSFFIALYNNEYRIAFRNGGSFNGMKRNSYFLVDSVSEGGSSSFYRFSEIKKGKQRAYTTLLFRNDSLYLQSYTNKYNTISTPSLHMSWSAKLQDTTSCQAAIDSFNFPQKIMTKDFSTSFNAVTEAIYYSSVSEPYPESAQPYLGSATIGYSYSGSYSPVAGKKVFLIITTQPLISGFTFISSNLKYRSRYVVLDANDLSFTFTAMHPGNYYLYALYDNDSNGNFTSGDWITTSNTTFTVTALGTTSASTIINFTLP